MSNPLTVEQRLENLEKDVAAVKQLLKAKPRPTNWLAGVVGSMAKYPDFRDVVRLGREIRQADRPDNEE